jgi:hypothetical protein
VQKCVLVWLAVYNYNLHLQEALAGVQFRPDESMDPSLLHSVSHILPICDQALAINYFAEQWNDMSKGLTAQVRAFPLLQRHSCCSTQEKKEGKK